MAAIKRIAADQLRVGMYVAELNNEWIPDSNQTRYGLIKRQAAVDQIIGLGVAHVFIDVEKGEDCADGILREELNQPLDQALNNIQKTADASVSSVPLEEELSPAKSIHGDALNLINRVMEDAKMGNAIALQGVEDMADSINESIRRNQNALSCFTRFRHKDEYLMEHSFSVAVLMGVLARSMGYHGDDLHQLVTGGLLHDVGKIQISNHILHKPSSLEPEEWEEMKRHVQYGEEILQQTDNMPTNILQICAQHHERIDGRGYPRGLSGAAITEHGKMGAVVDVYDAITADRVYHRGMLPTQAMKKLLEWTDGHLDKDIAYQFIACMSIYPAGSLVELRGQQLALVLEPNLRQQHQPLVKIIYDAKANTKVVPRTLNLVHCDVEQHIVRAVDPADYNLDLGQYF